MPFEPGKSGNPGGRPKADVRVKEMAREHTQEALDTLAAVMRDPDAVSSARVAAATALLDRGWGKPAQAVTNEEGEVFKMEVSWVSSKE